MKLTISIFFLLFGYLRAQNYTNDLAALYQKVESQVELSPDELEHFLKEYEKSLLQDPDNATQVHSIAGNTYYSLSLYEKAEKHFLLSYTYAQQAKDTTLKYIVAHSLAVYNHNANRLLEAEKYYLSCMAGMAAVYGQSSREYTEIFFNYTRLLIDLGKYTDAAPYVEALLYYYKTLDGEKNTRYISLLNCKAIIYQNTGNYEEAVSIYETIVKAQVLLELGDTLGQVISISNLGDIYRETGQFESAIQRLSEARTLFMQAGLSDKETLATIENNLALCYKSTNNLKSAEEAYNHALALYAQTGGTNSEPYCSTLSNKADLLRILGRYGEASELLIKALQIRRENFGDKTENYANALANLANVYFDAGSYMNESFYREALEKNLEAAEVYKLAVGDSHQSYGNCLNSLSLCYLQVKEYEKAEACKLKALEIIERSVGRDNYRYPAYLISTYGLYRKTNQLEKAEKNMKEALLLVEKNFGKKHDLYASAELALAEIYTLKQNYEAAAPMYFDCLGYYSGLIDGYFSAMSEQDQGNFLQTISVVFESYNLYVIHYKLGFPGKDLSQHVKLTLKYQLLLKSLLANKSARVRQEVANSPDENLKRLYNEWLALKNELINTYKSADAVSVDNNDLLKRTSELESQLKSKLGNFIKEDAVSFEGLKEKLNPNEAAIELFKVQEIINDSQSVAKYGALVIKKNSKEPELIIFEQGDKMDKAGFSNYSACIDEQLNDTLSYLLYFKPFEKALGDVNRLYVSSDGVFHKLSWQSLYNLQSKKYLADDYEIYQTSNLGSLQKSGEKSSQKKLNASLFGYPDYDYDFKLHQARENQKVNQVVAKRFGLSNLAKLPGTKTEVEEIAKELKAQKWNVTAFTDELASEENLRKVKSPHILHIATHGFYLKDVESDDKLFLGFETSTIKNNSLLRSGIILAGAGPATEDSTNRDSENDGVLTAYEAGLLDLSQTELVVLSACQTGLGDDMGTEGVAGLQRSFAIAGAKNIIMSLWPVDDFATQYLMTEFYKNYASSQNVELSFKTAQFAVKQKYPQPLYWAAFVLLKTFN